MATLRKASKKAAKKAKSTRSKARPTTTGQAKVAKKKSKAAKASKKASKAASRTAANARKGASSKTGSKPMTGATKARAKPTPSIEVDDDTLEFIEAIDEFKQSHSKPFPSWSEVLYVLKSLGYRK